MKKVSVVDKFGIQSVTLTTLVSGLNPVWVVLVWTVIKNEDLR